MALKWKSESCVPIPVEFVMSSSSSYGLFSMICISNPLLSPIYFLALNILLSRKNILIFLEVDISGIWHTKTFIIPLEAEANCSIWKGFHRFIKVYGKTKWLTLVHLASYKECMYQKVYCLTEMVSRKCHGVISDFRFLVTTREK